MNGIEVAKVNDQTHLGLTLQSDLSFKKHINEKIKKAKKHIGIIKYLSMYLPLKAHNRTYNVIVRPYFDNCDIIYHSPAKNLQLGSVLNTLMNNIERVQYQAALAITDTWQGSSRSKLYEELGWESLSDCRWCRRILKIHQILSNKTPIYLQDKLPRR